MPGLIPLVLKPLGANPSKATSAKHRVTSVVQPSRPSHSRQASTGSIATTKARTMRRLSQPTPMSLPILPYTPADWRRALAEIKRLHHNRKFRACSTRCCEILDNSRENIEPAYLIYLNFYAATSLEMCARSLQSPSPYRLTLLQRSKSHYEVVSNLINRAEETVPYSSAPGLADTSSSASLHSPTSSVSSCAWTADAASASPTTSVSSLEDLVSKVQSQPRQKRMKKKVSFSLPGEQTIPEEPIIRPDSPTLGFDEDYYVVAGTRSPKEVEELALPETPTIPMPTYQPPPVPVSQRFARPASILKSLEAGDMVRSRSVSRYREHLSVLRSQVSAHASNVEELLEPVTSSSPTRQPALSSSLRTTMDDLTVEEKRLEDRKARIERLRKSGWQRKRFDPQRYEALCDAVAAELA